MLFGSISTARFCGTCEQWIKEGKGAIKWTRLSCRTFAANAVRSSFMHSPCADTSWLSL
jgi:hypothetical protein